MGVFQPIGQKRLTNIAIVRYKKGGKRFEIACYKNKVLNWRSNVETDLDEVLQTTSIFTNVSKGILAKAEELMEVFGTTDERKISLIILEKGEVQVSDKERKVELETLFKDVATVLVEKCINPQTKRPYTMGVIERALRDVHFAVDPKRSAKAQALEVLPRLQERFPIERAQMRLRITVAQAHTAQLLSQLDEWKARLESRDLEGDSLAVCCLVDPGIFRQLDRAIHDEFNGRLEVLSVAASVASGQDDLLIEQHAASSSAPGPSASSASVVRDLGALGLEGGATLVRPREGGATTAAHQGGAEAPLRRAMAPTSIGAAAPSVSYEVVWARGAIGDLPEEHSSRKDRFAELDRLQPGWQVELRRKGDGAILDAVFFSPEGVVFKTFAEARREALMWSKKKG